MSTPRKSKPTIENPATKKLTRYRSSVPIKKLNKPKVNKFRGKDNNPKVGFTDMDTSPKTAEAAINTPTLS